MSRAASVIERLDDKSDWLSPLVVKEVRQIVRGRDFVLSFGLSLVVGLGVSFFGAADALAGSGNAGSWTFLALLGCLAFLGLAIVPLGAFNALRNERMEHTLELITLTALSPRRIVIGKLLAHAVKLATYFAAIAPFIAMSFLLGGIDFLTIVVAVVILLMWSVWIAALCLFFSTAFNSRAMSGVVFGVLGLLVFVGLNVGRMLMITRSFGGPAGAGFSGAPDWTSLGSMTALWMATLVNLLLLAENRLSLPTEDSVTPLRIGFLAQFLLIVAWCLLYLHDPSARRSAAQLAGLGSLHLAVVAMFTVTEELTVPRRVLARMRGDSRWRWLLATFGPGAGRGGLYVLAQMVVLIAAVSLFGSRDNNVHWAMAACGYILFFTGVPTLLWWQVAPSRATPMRLRVTILVMVAAFSVIPDMAHYVLWRPEVLDLKFGGRHLLSPFRALGDWTIVESYGWSLVPSALGFIGLVCYGALMRLTTIANEEPEPIVLPPTADARETGGDTQH